MKTFKICKNTNEIVKTEPVKGRLTLSGGSICLSGSREELGGLAEGGKLHFIKKAVGNDGKLVNVCDTDVIINEIVDDGETSRYVYFEYTEINRMKVASFEVIPEEAHSSYKYKITFDKDALVAQGNGDLRVSGDILRYKNITHNDLILYVNRSYDPAACGCKNKTDTYIVFKGLALCYPGELVAGRDIVSPETECCMPYDRRFNYETLERPAVLASLSAKSVGSAFVPMPGDAAFFCTNPYYFIGNDGKSVNLFENVTLEKYSDYFNISTVLEQDYDAKRAFQEHQVNNLFVKKIKSSIIPEFIDLEKVKYAPAFFVENKSGLIAAGPTGHIQLATGLTFNLHFRTRVYGDEPYSFEDVWHVNDDVDTWNGNGFDENGVEIGAHTQDTLYADEEFVNSSNLIGYLGFTDEDIYNQKNKVKKTFLRLSFYDSDNPLTQNLLCYSTIFMDGGDLYGKFVKKKAQLMEDKYYDEEVRPVVWASASTDENSVSSVTSQFIVNDEYDNTRSGEGFNIYMFRQDAPPEFIPDVPFEKQCKPIYMKVEFNHAGYGRTVPLIYWRKGEDGKPENITIGKYRKNLYIKLYTTLTDDGYVYMFDEAHSAEEENGRKNGIVWENERIVLNLFEPRIVADID